jgi:hypothetical protein
MILNMKEMKLESFRKLLNFLHPEISDEKIDEILKEVITCLFSFEENKSNKEILLKMIINFKTDLLKDIFKTDRIIEALFLKVLKYQQKFLQKIRFNGFSSTNFRDYFKDGIPLENDLLSFSKFYPSFYLYTCVFSGGIKSLC